MDPSDPTEAAAEFPRQVLSVSELTAALKEVLEGCFPKVWVSGEISNLSRPQSGHSYFTLKDDQAQIRAVLWRTAASRVKFDVQDGMQVICQGYLDLYAPRGTYQLVIEQMLPKGMGALELALRKLRERLTAEGLFDPNRKRPLPRFPRRIALVTSPTGAAVRDFLEVLRRRWRGVDVLIIPVRVQGSGAAREIAAGIELANRLRQPIDVLVVARGGGSLEDLWAFNEEPVVRAIFASQIPVISAVGHEIDVTLADLVADVRALTPSEAAERVAPAVEEVTALLQRQQHRLAAALKGRAARARAQLDTLAGSRSFRRPLELVQQLARRLDDLDCRMDNSIGGGLARSRAQVDAKAAHLESLSPLGVLSRGYSLTHKIENGRLVRSARDVSLGEPLITRFAFGHVVCRVEEIHE